MLLHKYMHNKLEIVTSYETGCLVWRRCWTTGRHGYCIMAYVLNILNTAISLLWVNPLCAPSLVKWISYTTMINPSLLDGRAPLQLACGNAGVKLREETKVRWSIIALDSSE